MYEMDCNQGNHHQINNGMGLAFFVLFVVVWGGGGGGGGAEGSSNPHPQIANIPHPDIFFCLISKQHKLVHAKILGLASCMQLPFDILKTAAS